MLTTWGKFAEGKTISDFGDEINAIEQRQKSFKEEIARYENEYPLDMLDNFYLYWSEPNNNNTRMRKELETTWDTSRRLMTWAKNDKNFRGINGTQRHINEDRESKLRAISESIFNDPDLK